MAFPVNPNPLSAASPDWDCACDCASVSPSGQLERECVCMCALRCALAGQGASLQRAGEQSPGSWKWLQTDTQAGSTSLRTQHRNQVVSACEKTHKARPGFRLAVSSFAVILPHSGGLRMERA